MQLISIPEVKKKSQLIIKYLFLNTKKIDMAFLYLWFISFLKYSWWLHMETAYGQEKHEVIIWIKLVILFGL